jgi:hypothetical protein
VRAPEAEGVVGQVGHVLRTRAACRTDRAAGGRRPRTPRRHRELGAGGSEDPRGQALPHRRGRSRLRGGGGPRAREAVPTALERGADRRPLGGAPGPGREAADAPRRFGFDGFDGQLLINARSETIGVPIAADVLYPFSRVLPSPIIASAAMSFSSVSVVRQRPSPRRESACRNRCKPGKRRPICCPISAPGAPEAELPRASPTDGHPAGLLHNAE